MKQIAYLAVYVLVLGVAAGVGLGLGFNLAAGPTFDRAERFVERIEKLISP